MFKRILFLAVVSIVAMMAQAQNLEGKWKSEQTDKEGKMDIALLISESELNLKLTATIDDTEGTIVLSVSLPCNYLRDGSKLSVTPHMEEAKVDLEKMEFKGELADSLDANPEMKEFFKAIVIGTLDEKKKDLLKDFSFKDVELQIVSQTDSTLCIRDDKDKEILFKRVKEE